MKFYMFVFILFIFLNLAFPVFAHEVGKEVKVNVIPNYIFLIWDFHDAIHWMIAIPFIFTCYYFRYFTGRRFLSHPMQCGYSEQAGRRYEGEFFLNKLHRYFFWLMLIFILIHLSEVIANSFNAISYNFRLFTPYIFPFTSESSTMQSELVQLLGNFAEWFYVLSFLIFLFSCHFLRYFIGGASFCYSCSPLGGARGEIYRWQTKFNDYHDVLFWLSAISMIFILAVGGHL